MRTAVKYNFRSWCKSNFHLFNYYIIHKKYQFVKKFQASARSSKFISLYLIVWQGSAPLRVWYCRKEAV
jgi:hypothetical protein